MLVGTGVAVGDGVFRGDALGGALVAAVAIQVAANYANDASDGARGADPEDRIGPPRLVATGVIPAKRMWLAAWLAVAVSAAAAVWLATIAGPVVLAVGVVSVAAMLAYSGGPVPYGYRGLGEVFVFVFFGMVATVGSRFVHDRALDPEAAVLAVPVGMLAVAILVANNYRDLETDARVGKRTLAVRLGRRRTQLLYAALAVGALALIAVAAVTGVVPRATGIAVLVAPLAVPPLRLMGSGSTGAAVGPVLAMTARLQLAVAVALATGAAL